MPSKRALTFKPGAFLKKIGSERSSREYSDKQPIFSQGDVADAMFYVEAGNVKQTVLSDRGKKAVIGIFHQGDVFGESCLGPAPQQTSTAVAIQDSRVARVERATILFNSSEKRLARTLLLLANFETDLKSDHAVLKISQGTLAQMIGTTRSRVSFFMNRFRRRGLIDYNGGLRVRRALLTFLLHE